MKCYIENVSEIAVMVDFHDGDDHLLKPGTRVNYDDRFKAPSDGTRMLASDGFVRVREYDEEYSFEKVCWIREGF